MVGRVVLTLRQVDLQFRFALCQSNNDGWNLIAELNEYGHPVGTYVWDNDLSGSLQGAGGVGGLLMCKQWHVGDNATTFPAYDGNGNVRGLFRSNNGTLETYCAYDPFGETFTYNRNPAAPNPFGFSGHYTDIETGFCYVKERYYKPKTGRWISRDRIGEKGGIGLYVYVNNQPTMLVDPYGMSIWDYLECVGNCIKDTNTELDNLIANGIACGTSFCLSFPIPKETCQLGQKPCQSVARTLNEWLFRKGINTGKIGAKICKIAGKGPIIVGGGIQLGIEIYCAKKCWGE